MMTTFSASKAAKKQGGYALLTVVFLTTLVLMATMSVGLRIVTEGRREKEQEMIWRGKQYVRGIKLYYAKYGKFPTSLDDLTKQSNGNIRFLRQAYTDPMNKEDGSWRLIYVGPAGQLIGSLKPQPNPFQIPGGAGQVGGVGQVGANGQPGSVPGASTFGFGSQPGAGSAGSNTGFSFGASSSSTGTTGTGFGAQSTDSNGTGTGAQGTDANGTGTGTGTGTDTDAALLSDTPTIMGGNIIGIGSKVNKASIIVYEKAKNYKLFEFVWDPSKDMGIISSGTPPGTATGTSSTPGQNPAGTQPGAQPNPPGAPNPGPPLANPDQP